MPLLNDNYKKYIASKEWKHKREEFARAKDYLCEVCQQDVSDRFDVHHKTYKNFGNEPFGDLELLCRKCHKKEEHNKQNRKREIAMIETAEEFLQSKALMDKEKGLYLKKKNIVSIDEIHENDFFYVRLRDHVTSQWCSEFYGKMVKKTQHFCNAIWLKERRVFGEEKEFKWKKICTKISSIAEEWRGVSWQGIKPIDSKNILKQFKKSIVTEVWSVDSYGEN